MQLQVIHKKIFEIRGQKVMLDFDLAELYEVETRTLKQAVNRNMDLFPDDFMFEISLSEMKNLTSQIVMSSSGWGGTRHLPYAFTEHGVAMLSNLLKSKKARKTSIAIVRAFIALKDFALSYKQLAAQIKKLEKKYNKQFVDVYEALKYLMKDKQKKDHWNKRKRIGFNINVPKKKK